MIDAVPRVLLSGRPYRTASVSERVRDAEPHTFAETKTRSLTLAVL
jgi:hypothetical protein